MHLAEKHQRWLGPLLLLLVCVLYYWKLTLTRQYVWFDSPDLVNQVIPWWNVQAREWHSGRFPLWDPSTWTGQPLLGQAQPGAAYPLNWLLFLSPLTNGTLRPVFLNAYFVLIHVIAAVNAYLLCRFLRVSWLGSLLGGAIFSLAGFLGYVAWPQMMNGAIWSPLVFLFQLAAADRRERPFANAAVSGFFLGFSWLAGHHQPALFFTYASAAFWLYLIFRRRFDGFLARQAALSLVCFVGVSALQTLPAAEYARLAVRWVNSPQDPVGWDRAVPYHVHEGHAITPADLPALVLPGFSRDVNPYLGWVVVALAAAGFIATNRAWTTRALAWLSLGGLLVALGPFSWLHGILYALVPLMEKARTPGMAFALTSLGAAVLAARGLDSILDARRCRVWLVRILLGSGLVIAIGATAQAYANGGRQDPLMASALVAFSLAAVLRFTPHARLALSALCLFELAADSLPWVTNRDNPPESSAFVHVERAAELVQYLRTLPRDARIEISDQDVPFNAGGWFGLPQRNGYLASITRNHFAWDLPDHRRQEASAARYHVSREPPAPHYASRYTDPRGISVWENPRAMPRRSWIVHTVFPALEPGEGIAWWKSALPYADSAFVPGPAPRLPVPPAACQDPAPQIEDPHPARVIVQAELACAGFLVLADTDYPGWSATVDGRPAPILAAYGMFRGVVLEAGRHRVEFQYRPASVFAGLALTGLFSFGTLLLWRSKL